MYSRQCLNAGRVLSKIRRQVFGEVVLRQNITTRSILRQCSLRSIYTNSVRCSIAHFSGENFVAHNVMKSTKEKYMLAEETTCRDDLTLEQFVDTLNPSSSLTTDEIVDAFKVLSDYAHNESIDICSNIFDNFLDTLTDSFHNMTIGQLCEVFKNFRKWPITESPKTRNFIEIWTALDDVLKQRCESWSTDDLILFLDHIYRSLLIRHFTFAKYAISKLTRKAKHLTPSQVVQLSFYAGTSRWKYDMFDIEMRFFDCIDFLTLEEIGIVCMGFFKTQTQFRDPQLLKTIIRKLQLTVEPLDNVLVTSILKMIKYSITDENNDELKVLFDWFTKRTYSLSPMACTHLAISGTTSRLKHEPLLNALAENFKKNAETIRLKDLERLACAYTMFNMDVVNNIPVLDIIVDELRKPKRKEEMHKHSTSFVNCLMFLTIKSKFPLDLIAYALSEEFIENYYAYHLRNGKSLYIVNNSVKIECKRWYKGPFLSEKQQIDLAKKYCRYMPEKGGRYRLNTEQLGVMDIMNTIANHRGSSNFVKPIHCLPHFDKGDLVICNGPINGPIKVENYFPKKEWGKIYPAPDNKKTWVAIVASGPQGNIWNSKERTGAIEMKMRQLKAIKYTPVHIPLLEWQQLKSAVEKVDYLKNLMMTVDFIF